MEAQNDNFKEKKTLQLQQNNASQHFKTNKNTNEHNFTPEYKL
jgi:hypothetical protein